MFEKKPSNETSHPALKKIIFVFLQTLSINLAGQSLTSGQRADQLNNIREINHTDINKLDITNPSSDSLLRGVFLKTLKTEEIKSYLEIENDSRIDSFDYYLQIIKAQLHATDSLITNNPRIKKEEDADSIKVRTSFSNNSSQYKEGEILLAWFHFFDLSKNYPTVHEVWHSVDYPNFKEYQTLYKSIFNDFKKRDLIVRNLTNFLNEKNPYPYDLEKTKRKIISVYEKIEETQTKLDSITPELDNNTEENREEFITETIKLLVLIAEKKHLEEIIRTYNNAQVQKTNKEKRSIQEIATDQHNSDLAEYFISENEFLSFTMQFYRFLTEKYKENELNSPEEILEKIRQDKELEQNDLYFQMFLVFNDKELLEILKFASETYYAEYEDFHPKIKKD